MYTTAVIDNSSLVNITQLHAIAPFFDKLKSILRTLYIPLEVKNEYVIGAKKENDRNWILQRLNTEQGFYRLCTSYDSVVLSTVLTYRGIDKGEAEVLAQMLKVEIPLIISDDKPFIDAVKKFNERIVIYNTLHLICWLDIVCFINNWNSLIQQLHKIRPFKSKELRDAYLQVSQHISIAIDSRKLSKKCSLKTILLSRTEA